jgi:hypothetical protein
LPFPFPAIFKVASASFILAASASASLSASGASAMPLAISALFPLRRQNVMPARRLSTAEIAIRFGCGVDTIQRKLAEARWLHTSPSAVSNGICRLRCIDRGARVRHSTRARLRTKPG